MSSLGVAYKIKSGDTLWSIAAKEMGAGSQWPRIYAFNNMADVNKTGVRKIINPDLIYAGETIRLPIAPRVPKSSATTQSAPKQSLNNELPNIQIPFMAGYDIDSKPIERDYGTFVAKISLSGRVIIRLGRTVPVT